MITGNGDEIGRRTKPSMDTETTLDGLKERNVKATFFDRENAEKRRNFKERIGRRASGRQSYVSPCGNHTCTG